MKITKNTLKRMIKEELGRVLREQEDDNEIRAFIERCAGHILKNIEQNYSPNYHRSQGFDLERYPHFNVYGYMTSRKYENINLESSFDIYKAAVQKLKAHLQKNYSDDSQLGYTMDQIEQVLAADSSFKPNY